MSDGMPRSQVYTIASGMHEAYDNAKSYATTVIIILVACGQGLTTLLISSRPEEKAKQPTPADKPLGLK